MKLTISILFCVILTLQYNSADAALKNFFGKIHDSVHGAATKVREDLNTLFHPNASKPQENTESSNIHFEDESKEDVTADAAAKKPEEVTLAPPTSTSTVAPPTSTSTVAPSASTSTVAPSASTTNLSPSTSATTLAPTTTTKKDGRENFSGACLAGYMRTPDGRCKPTF